MCRIALQLKDAFEHAQMHRAIATPVRAVALAADPQEPLPLPGMEANSKDEPCPLSDGGGQSPSMDELASALKKAMTADQAPLKESSNVLPPFVVWILTCKVLVGEE